MTDDPTDMFQEIAEMRDASLALTREAERALAIARDRIGDLTEGVALTPDPMLRAIVQMCLDQLRESVQELPEVLEKVDVSVPEYVGWMQAAAESISALGRMAAAVAGQMRLLHEYERRSQSGHP